MKIINKYDHSDKINGLCKITLDTFQDFRGEIWTLYSERGNEFCDHKFVADKITISRFGVLRGFHGDPYTAKLVSCLSGQFQFAVADTRKDSETYGNVETYLVSDNEPAVIVVPAGCVNAHLCLSDKCVFYYKWSEEYNGPESQITVAWDDPDIGVDWAIKSPILSERDKHGVKLKEVRLCH